MNAVIISFFFSPLLLSTTVFTAIIVPIITKEHLAREISSVKEEEKKGRKASEINEFFLFSYPLSPVMHKL